MHARCSYQKVQLARAVGYVHDLSKGDPTVEDVAANIDKISSMKNHTLADHASMMPGSLLGMQNVARSALPWMLACLLRGPSHLRGGIA
jgi:hypothetical protein